MTATIETIDIAHIVKTAQPMPTETSFASAPQTGALEPQTFDVVATERLESTAPLHLGSTTLSNLTSEIDETLARWGRPDPSSYSESTSILNAWNRAELMRSIPSGLGDFAVTIAWQMGALSEERRIANDSLADGHNHEWGMEYLADLDARLATLVGHEHAMIPMTHEPVHYRTAAALAPRPPKRTAARLGLQPVGLSYVLAERMGYNLRALVNEHSHVLEVRDLVNAHLELHPDATQDEIDAAILTFSGAVEAKSAQQSPFEHVGIDMGIDLPRLPKPGSRLEWVHEKVESASKWLAKHRTTASQHALALATKLRFARYLPNWKLATATVTAVTAVALIAEFMTNTVGAASSFGNSLREALSQRLGRS